MAEAGLATWLVALLALACFISLFLIASLAQTATCSAWLQRWRAPVYALTLGIYCSSWTFYGAVGTAARSGWDYLPIFLGPLLLLLFGQPLLLKLLQLTKKHNLSSIADFISARYGKSTVVGGWVTLFCMLVVLPYIALQLKAVTSSFQMLLALPISHSLLWWQDPALWSAGALAMFGLCFGNRTLNLTRQNPGVMTAIAVESLLKLVALCALAVALCLWVLPPPMQVLSDFVQQPAAQKLPDFGLTFWLKTALAAAAMLVLPRLFHVTFVENSAAEDLRSARFWFGGYLLLAALVVMPIAVAGRSLFPEQLTSADQFVLMLPLQLQWSGLTLLVFVGGFAAATSMMIVASLVLSGMLCNQLLLPLLLKRHMQSKAADTEPGLGPSILWLRRLIIMLVMVLAYGYYRLFAHHEQLAETGLLVFALVVQLLPAILGGLYWQQGHAKGVLAGLLVGVIAWFYCLMLPQLAAIGLIDAQLVQQGPWQLSWLKPTALLGITTDPLTHAVCWSLGLNCLLYFWLSQRTQSSTLDRLQAQAFVNPSGEMALQAQPLAKSLHQAAGRNLPLELTQLLTRFVGQTRATEVLQAFRSQNVLWTQSRGDPQPAQPDQLTLTAPIAQNLALTELVERELAAVIGSASASTMVTVALQGKQLAVADVVDLLADTQQAMQFSREILHATLAHLSQGVSVINKDLQLVAWNSAYLQLFAYPPGLICVGRPVADLLRYNAKLGRCGAGEVETLVDKRLQHLKNAQPYVFQRVRPDGQVIEIRGNPIAGGGFVCSYADVTCQVQTLQQLAVAKQQSEQQVVTATAEVQQINAELRAEIKLRGATEQRLLAATLAAQQANASKSRFLALASHDILQPLNAARLFAAALHTELADASGKHTLTQLENSLQATEELMATLLDIARLDENKQSIVAEPVQVSALLQQLADEFGLLAQQKQLAFRLYAGQWWGQSHPTYLRRILQNIISNAIKYTAKGRIVIACRRRGLQLKIEVWDTGSGIDSAHLSTIFDDFYRVAADSKGQAGLGLGLGVVQRMVKILGHQLVVRSTLGAGSCFSLTLPFVARDTTYKAVLPRIAGSLANHDTASQRLALASKQAGSATTTACHIWCIDDDGNNLLGMQQLLQQWQIGNVSIDLSATEALARQFGDSPPHLLIVDYQLGGNINGIQLFLQLKQQWPQLFGMLVSADPATELQTMASNAGLLFLAKPIKAAPLRSAINYLNMQRRSQHAGSA